MKQTSSVFIEHPSCNYVVALDSKVLVVVMDQTDAGRKLAWRIAELLNGTTT